MSLNTFTELIDLSPPRIVHRPILRLVGLSDRYTQDSTFRIPALWERFMAALGTVPGRVGERAYGASYNFDAEGGFDYMAGVEVASSAVVGGELSLLVIPDAPYAVFTHRGHISVIGRTWAEIQVHGLREAGLRAANAPAFELYDERFDALTGEGVVEIWVPVED